MIKKGIKKILLRFIKAINLPHLIDEVKHQQKITQYNSVTTNNGSIFYPEAEVVNLSGKADKIILGHNTHIRGELTVYAYAKGLRIGNDCYIGKNSSISVAEEVIIGDNVLISHNVNIFDTNSHEIDHIERSESYKILVMSGHASAKGNVAVAPVIIEDFVWISFNVIILKGITIGKGAIIAAGSVVTKDVAQFTLVAGNPAKVLKNIGTI